MRARGGFLSSRSLRKRFMSCSLPSMMISTPASPRFLT